MSKTLYAGVDVSLDRNQLCLMDDSGNVVNKSISFINNLPGTMEMLEYLTSTMDSSNFEKLTIGMEATALYWFPLFSFLSSSSELSERDANIVPLNPKIVSNFRSAYPDMDKTDIKDSFVIADRLRFGRVPKGYLPDINFLALQRLTRFRYHLTQHQSQLKNYVQSFLFLTFSEWIRNGVFSDLFGATSKQLLKKFHSAAELSQMSLDDLKEILVKFSKGHFKDPDEKTQLVSQSAEASFPVAKALADQVHLLIKQTLQQLELLEKHIARLDKKIAKLMENFPNPLESIPGIGPVLAAGIISEIGDISRFPGQAQLAKYAGLTWRKNQSGGFNGDVTPLTKTGNSFLRYYLLQAAQSMRMHNPEYREYYNRKFKETPRHPHKRALSLTARKLVRLVFALLSRNQLYMAPQERESRQATREELSILIPNPAAVKSASNAVATPKTAAKKVKPTVAARSTRTPPLQQEHEAAVNT